MLGGKNMRNLPLVSVLCLGGVLLSSCGGGDRDRLYAICVKRAASSKETCGCLADGAKKNLSPKGLKAFTDFVEKGENGMASLIQLDRELGIEDSQAVGSLIEECRL